jgi:hypothetical protein
MLLNLLLAFAMLFAPSTGSLKLAVTPETANVNEVRTVTLTVTGPFEGQVCLLAIYEDKPVGHLCPTEWEDVDVDADNVESIPIPVKAPGVGEFLVQAVSSAKVESNKVTFNVTE